MKSCAGSENVPGPKPKQELERLPIANLPHGERALLRPLPPSSHSHFCLGAGAAGIEAGVPAPFSSSPSSPRLPSVPVNPPAHKIDH